MNVLPIELIIKLFEKIYIRNVRLFIKYSKINKKFNHVYKKYFEKKIKIEFESNPLGRLMYCTIYRNHDRAPYYHIINTNIELNNKFKK